MVIGSVIDENVRGVKEDWEIPKRDLNPISSATVYLVSISDLHTREGPYLPPLSLVELHAQQFLSFMLLSVLSLGMLPVTYTDLTACCEHSAHPQADPHWEELLPTMPTPVLPIGTC